MFVWFCCCYFERHCGLGVTPLLLCRITMQRPRGGHYEGVVCHLHICN